MTYLQTNRLRNAYFKANKKDVEDVIDLSNKLIDIINNEFLNNYDDLQKSFIKEYRKYVNELDSITILGEVLVSFDKKLYDGLNLSNVIIDFGLRNKLVPEISSKITYIPRELVSAEKLNILKTNKEFCNIVNEIFFKSKFISNKLNLFSKILENVNITLGKINKYCPNLKKYYGED